MKKLFLISFAVITSMILAIPTFAENMSTQKDANVTAEWEQNNIEDRKFQKSYDYSNYELTSKTNFQVVIKLNRSQPYGKAYFYNASDYPATLYVEDQEITIEPHTGDSIVWEKSFFKSSYDVGITASEERLHGLFSLAKADDSATFA